MRARLLVGGLGARGPAAAQRQSRHGTSLRSTRHPCGADVLDPSGTRDRAPGPSGGQQSPSGRPGDGRHERRRARPGASTIGAGRAAGGRAARHRAVRQRRSGGTGRRQRRRTPGGRQSGGSAAPPGAGTLAGAARARGARCAGHRRDAPASAGCAGPVPRPGAGAGAGAGTRLLRRGRRGRPARRLRAGRRRARGRARRRRRRPGRPAQARAGVQAVGAGGDVGQQGQGVRRPSSAAASGSAGRERGEPVGLVRGPRRARSSSGAASSVLDGALGQPGGALGGLVVHRLAASRARAPGRPRRPARWPAGPGARRPAGRSAPLVDQRLAARRAGCWRSRAGSGRGRRRPARAASARCRA